MERYFDDLSRRRYADIARAMKLSLDRIMESIEEIQTLEPKPGRQFAVVDSRYIVPDVTIQKVGADYVVVLNEEGIPRLRVNSLYRSLLRRSGDEAKQYVEQKLRSAVWLIKSVEQRQRTLRKVAHSLVKFQREFLDKGLAAPPAARAPRRRRGHQDARVDDQPRDHEQVRADPPGPVRAEVLLPQRHRVDQRRRWCRRCR